MSSDDDSFVTALRVLYAQRILMADRDCDAESALTVLDTLACETGQPRATVAAALVRARVIVESTAALRALKDTVRYRSELN